VTKRATATQAQVRRMIKAAKWEGLHVAGIRPDGTVVTYSGEHNPLAPVDRGATDLSGSLDEWMAKRARAFEGHQ
jgi:hypothetical protein